MKSFGLALCLFSLGTMADPDPNHEQLLGARVDERGITFQVRSNGCTDKQHFEFDVVEQLEPVSPMLPALEHHHYITVIRLAPDFCEKLVPYGTEIFVSFEELGISFGKFHINNPIGGDKINILP